MLGKKVPYRYKFAFRSFTLDFKDTEIFEDDSVSSGTGPVLLITLNIYAILILEGINSSLILCFLSWFIKNEKWFVSYEMPKICDRSDNRTKPCLGKDSFTGLISNFSDPTDFSSTEKLLDNTN